MSESEWPWNRTWFCSNQGQFNQTRANWNVFRYQIRFFFRKLGLKHQKELLWMLLSERFERYYYISLYVLLYYYPFFKRRQMSHVQFICWEYVLIDCIIIWHYKNKLVINFISQYKQFWCRNSPIFNQNLTILTKNSKKTRN